MKGRARRFPHVPFPTRERHDLAAALCGGSDGEGSQMVDSIERLAVSEDATAAPAPHAMSGPVGGSDDSKPLLRGWMHAAAAPAALIFTVFLVLRAPAEQRLTLLIYGVSLVELYTVSALFHLGSWRRKAYMRWRLLDHASIFVAIAGADTALATLPQSAPAYTALLCLTWAAAGGGICVKLCHPRMSRNLSAALYLMMGWVGGCVALAAWWSLAAPTPPSPWLMLVGLAGLLHSVGALVYVRRQPDWWPSVFGYHELFHVLVVLGNAAISLVVLRTVLP